MAKQRTMGPSSTLLSASAALAESKSSTPVLEAVAAGFGKAIKMVEEEQRLYQDKVNEYMGDLKTDIDFTTLEPSMEKEVRRALLEGKNEYSTLASELARLGDASDPRYQEIVDRMEGIRQEYSTMAAEITAYNQDKITTAQQIQNQEYSKGTDQLGRVSSVYGLDGTKPSVSISGGHLNFNVNGETISYAKMKKLPGVATQVADSILGVQVDLSKRGTPMTPEEKRRYARTIDDSLRNPDTLASILSDYPEELPFTDLREKLFELRASGNLDSAALDEIRTEVKNRLLNGYEEASARGVAAARKAKAAQANPTKPTDKPNDLRFGSTQEIESVYTEMNKLQTAKYGGEDVPNYITIPNKPNLQLRFVQDTDAQNDPGYWVWMGRSSASGAWKPLRQSDGSIDIIPDARDWYFAATGQI